MLIRAEKYPFPTPGYPDERPRAQPTTRKKNGPEGKELMIQESKTGVTNRGNEGELGGCEIKTK